MNSYNGTIWKKTQLGIEIKAIPVHCSNMLILEEHVLYDDGSMMKITVPNVDVWAEDNPYWERIL